MNSINITNVTMNNLKNISLSIPLEKYIAFIGRSGSGKSTLAVDVIMAGYINQTKGVSVPIKPALFKQRVSNYRKRDVFLWQYLSKKESPKNTAIYLSEYLTTIKTASRFSAADLIVIAKNLKIDSFTIDASISGMSLCEYNMCRFMKILINSDAELFIIDELGAGLSYTESLQVSEVLTYMVSLGFSVIAIDHSMPIIASSDFIVELGPFSGDEGGEILFHGTAEKFKKTNRWKTMHNAYTEKLVIEQGSKKLLRIKDINFHSFSHLDIAIPLHGIVSICGSMGAGKSSLLDIIFRAYDKSANAWKNKIGIHGDIDGKNYIRRPYIIDQEMIGNNAMSTPATYTGIMDGLRNIYLNTVDNKNYRFALSDFSYNSSGKCPKCKGAGCHEIEVNEEKLYIICSDCGGSRYDKRIQKVKENGFSIGELLRISCKKLYALYSKDNKKTLITEKIKFINEVGLSYLNLGQPSTTLSGGESQRIKITKELAKKLGDRCLFLLDSPAKGLHVEDMIHIIGILKKLVDKNNSIVIGENHPLFIANSDWVIYLDKGKAAYSGKPEQLPVQYKKFLGIGVTL
jgi:excinuclease ABC subunit A